MFRVYKINIAMSPVFLVHSIEKHIFRLKF
jgi:hypothetical protein